MPRDTDRVTDGRRDDVRTSVLSLGFDTVEEGPDWPVVTIKVDGQDPFAPVAKDWRGFDPDEILGREAPLLPDGDGRRVAVYRCSCGIAGCGVIAPYIVRSSDGRLISWVDFRDFVGVFNGPTSAATQRHDGTPWNALPTIHFVREQYEAEVERAAADRSWETPRRKTARLVDERLRNLALELPTGLHLRWVAPAWRADGIDVSFERDYHQSASGAAQQLLRLTSTHEDLETAAIDMVDRLANTAPEDRVQAFGRRHNDA